MPPQPPCHPCITLNPICTRICSLTHTLIRLNILTYKHIHKRIRIRSLSRTRTRPITIRRYRPRAPHLRIAMPRHFRRTFPTRMSLK